MSNNNESSTDRVLQLLSLLHERDSVRVLDAAEALGVAQSTAHRLLSSLVRESFAVQDGSRSYKISEGYLQKYSRKTLFSKLLQASDVAVSTLAEMTGETTYLMTLSGAYAYVLASKESTSHELKLGNGLGPLLPAHRSAGGRLLLRSDSLAELHARYPDGPPAESNYDSIDDLYRDLHSSSEDYSYTMGGMERGVTGIAGAMTDATGRAYAALVVAAPTFRLNKSQIPKTVQHIRFVAREFEQRIQES